MLFQKKCCFLVLLLVIATVLGEFDDNNTAGDHHEENKLNSIVRCNYTETGARSCANCNDLLLCSRLNVGILAPCLGNRKHCNDGHCSETPSASCNSTSNAGVRRGSVGFTVSWGKRR